ncbi:MAG: metal-sensitive transcriptional regulator [Planctomycetota bacterium]|jgi:DNA-binding FrmR family transcriptional regulator
MTTETVTKRGTKHTEDILRLRRIEGQVRGIQKMIDDRRYCVDIITQLQSISSAIARVQERILKRHIEHCVAEAIRSGRKEDQQEKVEEIIEVLKNYGK